MAKINPLELADDSNDILRCTAGPRVLVGVGIEYFIINGKDVVDVRFVSVGKEEPGHIHTETFWLNAASHWRLAKFAVSIGWTEPFDPDEKEELEQVVAHGPLRGTITVQEVNGYDRSKIERFSRVTIDRDPTTKTAIFSPQQEKLIRKAEEQWAGYMRWRADNPRQTSGSSSNKPIPKRASADESFDDEVPF